MTYFKLGEEEGELLQKIYEAALKPSQWQNVLATICRQIDAEEGSLLFCDAQNPTRNFLQIASHDDPLINNQYITNENLFANNQTLSANSFLEEKTVLPLLRSEYITATIGFHSRAGAPDLAPNAVEYLQRLTPHLMRAIRIYQQVTTVKQHNYSLVESLKHTNLGVFLLDENLRVLFSTPEAQRVLQKNPILRIGRFGQLEVLDLRQQTQLDAILQSALKQEFNDEQLIQNIALHNKGKTHPLKISVMPVAEQSSLNPSALRLGVFITDPERPRQISQAYLHQAYAFTRTETQIAQLLLNGLSVADIANQRTTTLETARWQIKSLMQKTHTNSQAELTRLLMALSADFFDAGILTYQEP